MKHKLLKSLLLLSALVVGSSSVWADVSTLTPTSSTIAPSDDHFTVSYANGGGSTTIWGANSCVRFYAKNTITFESKNEEKITQITFTGTVNANKSGTYPTSMSASVGSITPSTISSTGSTDFSWTYATGATSVTLTIGGTAGNIDLSGGEYVITYTPGAGGSEPSISASNVNIAQDATNGSIAYTLNNATGSVTANVTTGDWLTLGAITASAVPFTCSANTGAERTATVTLSFEGAKDKVVTITQAPKTVATLTFSLDGGSYMQGTTFTLTSAGNTIYYTTDGTAPSNTSTEYNAPVAIAAGKVTYKAIAYDTYGNASTVKTCTYTGIAPATLPFSWTGTSTAGKSNLGSVTGVAGYSLGSDYAASNAPYRLKFEAVNNYVTIYTDAKPENVYFTVKLLGGKCDTGSKIKVQGSADGLTFDDIEEFTMQGAANKEFEFTTSNAFAATHRAVKLVMSSKDQNVGVGTISIVGSSLPATLNASGYATFASVFPLDFSSISGFTAWKITGANSSTKAITLSQITGTVAAGTGIFLQGTASATVNIPVAASGTDISATNLLEGITTATAVTANQYYGLSGTKFVKVNAGTVPAGKALLPTSAVTSSVKEFTFDFDETPDGIVSPLGETEEGAGAIYNLAGQRLQKMQKGINIVNGKKILK